MGSYPGAAPGYPGPPHPFPSGSQYPPYAGSQSPMPSNHASLMQQQAMGRHRFPPPAAEGVSPGGSAVVDGAPYQVRIMMYYSVCACVCMCVCVHVHVCVCVHVCVHVWGTGFGFKKSSCLLVCCFPRDYKQSEERPLIPLQPCVETILPQFVYSTSCMLFQLLSW